VVILHIANIDSSIIGGVQVAVPQLVLAQSKYATVGLLNTNGTKIDGITMLPVKEQFCLESFEPPFNKPDIVIFHEIYKFEYIKIYKELKDKNIPYVIIPHGGLTKQAQHRKFLKKAVANLVFFGSFINSAKAIQYLSKREAENSVFNIESFVCGNGIRMPAKHKNVFCENGIKLLYIGRLEVEIKGLDLLVKAVAESRALFEKSKCKLFIYGPDYDNSHASLSKLITENGVEDLIVLNREITDKAKEEELLSADYFVQSSRSEGMPMGILEALSYGLPCIVTEGTGLAELIVESNAGYGCETSVLGIKGALKAAIEGRSDISSKSQAAVKLALNKFDQSIVAAGAVDNYKRIIGFTKHR